MSDVQWPSACSQTCSYACEVEAAGQADEVLFPVAPGPVDENVCRADGPFELEVGEIRIDPPPPSGDTAEVIARYEAILPREIRFDSDSTRLGVGPTFQLSGLASSLNRPNLPFKVFITGHTDDTGSEARNLALSEDRVVAVGTYLLEHNANVVVEGQGHGSRDPVADNATPEGRAANRRVEISLRPLEGR